MTVATTDGETIWAFRYSSEGRSRSLFHSTDVSTLRHQYPDNPVLHELSDDARLVVSEPLGDLRGAWREVPESTCVTITAGTDRLQTVPAGVAPDRRQRLDWTSAICVWFSVAKVDSAEPSGPELYLVTSGFGGAEGTRTPDPLVANEVRYQLRHSPRCARRREGKR